MVAIAPVEFDERGLQDSIGDLQNIMGQLEAYRLQAEAYRDLQRDHEVLQRDHASLRREITAARAALLQAGQQAAPFVSFCQSRYNLLRIRLENTQLRLAETESALADRRDNSQEIACLRDPFQAHQRLHEDVVADFQRQMDELEARLAASGPVNAAQLAQATAERDAAMIERDTAKIACDTAKVERDAATIERDTMKIASDTIKAERNAAKIMRCSQLRV